MASTFSTNLALELIGTGDQAGTWGNTTNTNLGTLIEQAISGYVTQAVTTGNTTTITIPDGATGVARNMYIELTGTGGSNTFVEVPAKRKLYFIYNNTTGAVTVRVSGQTGVSVAASEKKILVNNGTDIVEATSYLTAINSSLTLSTLSVASLTISSGTANGVLYLNASKVATSGSALVFDGTTFSNSISGGVGFKATATSGTSSIRQQFVNTGGTFSVGLDASNGAIFGANYAGVMWHDGNYPLVFGVNNAEQMRLTSTGLGIGTTSPAALLHADKTGITDGSSAEVARFQGTVSGGATNTNLRISSSVSAGSAASRYVSLGVFDHASASRDLVLQPSGGNVGIGTTIPTNKLEVAGTTATTIATVKTTTGLSAFALSSTGGLAGLYIDNSAATSFGKGAYSRNLYSDGAYPLIFWTNDAERARITATGNLLVGTTTDVSGFSGVISDVAGNVRNIPSAGAAKTSEYTLTISDVGEFVTIGTSGKVLIPNNTFATGNAISVYNDTTGNVSLNISTTTGYVVGTNTNRTGVTLATRGIATVLFINPSYCIVSGNVS